MESNPKRLAEIRARLVDMKRKPDVLRAEKEQLRTALGRASRRRGEVDPD